MTDRCDVRIGWVLAGCRGAWASDVRYVSTSLPVEEIARLTARKVVTRIGLELLKAKHGLRDKAV